MTKKVVPRLQDQEGWLVDVVAFSADERAQLTRCLSDNGVAADMVDTVIDSLADACCLGMELYRLRNDAASAAQERAALEIIGQHAGALADAIRRADDGTWARLAEIAHSQIGDWQRLDELTAMLDGLARGADAALATIPHSYGRPPTAVEQVKLIHDALVKGGANIKVNHKPSPFYRVAEACFKVMNIHSLEHAIRKYKETLAGG